jgi:hypothetical protein
MQKNYRYELTEPTGRNFDPEFRPELTPAQMLRLGVFGGKYMTDCRGEFPRSWFAGAKLAKDKYDPALNFFGVKASQSLAQWRRRMPEEDARQIGRWKAIRRHVRQIERHCEPGDLTCRKRQRQALLHWAYDSRRI